MMALQGPLQLFVTHVDSDGPFLRISGQLNKQSACMVESLLKSSNESFENGVGIVPATAIIEGAICAAKYKDGNYYRAKVTSTVNLANGLVGVHFIDYGNKDTISLSTIRYLDNYDPLLLDLCGQATDYYLARIMQPNRWEEVHLLKLQSLLCYSEYSIAIEAHTPSYPIISVQFQGNDLSRHLVANKYGIEIPVVKQEVILQKSNENLQSINSNYHHNYVTEPIEHVPFYTNQNFPANPASTMRLQQNMPITFNRPYTPLPFAISQRLLVNRASRTAVNLKGPAPLKQLQQQPPPMPPTISHVATSPIVKVPSTPTSTNASPSKQLSTKTYKSKLLELNSQHRVFVSYSDEGPHLFAVQLVGDAKRLQDMMDDINKKPHHSLTEPPMIGTVCLGRMSGDRIICRAIVMNLSESQCKLFFVDFGDTEMVSYYDIFDIPEEFVKPNVFAMRFCLSGVKKLERGPHLNEAFKHLVSGKILALRVVAPEGPPLIQYGELYLDGKNVLDLLINMLKKSLQFKWMETLARGSKLSILVSYVDSCQKFFVQLSDQIEELNSVMDAVKAHCERTSHPAPLALGAACCARFSDDGNWYRAMVKGTRGDKYIVAYVDYGNEQEVNLSDLRTITPELMELPAQALKCALKGYEDKPVETKTSNQLEMLALEKTLMAHVMGIISNDTMLVTLIDDTVSPPMDVAGKMTQLSQPRSHEPTTPSRKDAPDQFSADEFSFSPRGSSFRGKESRDFDGHGKGKHGDKFTGNSNKGDRRGVKPGENNSASSPISAADDEWNEAPPAPTQPRQNNRDFRDKRKPRADQQFEKPIQKPGWKKNDGPNKRLKLSSDDGNQSSQKSSIQDRLRRENKFNKYDDEKKGNWDNQSRSREGPERSDRKERGNWGDKKDRDNWGDKKENFQQKREFRDNRTERSDRPARSNFTPRDRVDRPFGSDDKSENNFEDNHSGRAPPFKTRSKFTQVQYKELPNPVPLETPYPEPPIEPNSQHEVSVTWIISPGNFYTQILSSQQKFLDMMHTIPEMYKGVKSYTGTITVGASVLAKYPEDGVLYRATVISAHSFGKFIVQYIDFGNKFLVDAREIWQLDAQLMELPRMAVNCSLLGVVPTEGEWKANSDIDLCFNAPRYQCVFQDSVEGKYNVSLWNNGISVADTLIEKQLAAASDASGSAVTLKDEAIDLTIILGQQILCRVTNIESFEKFYVQLDLTKTALVEAAIANFEANLLPPLAADSLADGAHCTVKHEDKIYRAILCDVSDTANIKAVLPDYGLNITTNLENLMILPTELSVYYYQSLECCFNNYTEESEKLLSLDELKQQLTNNKFIIYINDVDGIRLVTTLYNVETGKKIEIFTPDEGAYDQVTPFCARSVFNYNFGLAYISHIENLNEIYLQKTEDGDRLAQLLDSLYQYYEEGTPENLTSFEADEMCVAKSSDGNWYRSIIVSSTECECTVQFSDYGNSETVPKDSVKKLDIQFYEPCALALVVSSGLVALSDDAVVKMREWTDEKELQVTLSFGSDGWLAALHLDGVDILMKLVNESLATPQVASADAKTVDTMETAIAETVFVPEGCTQVYISHIDTPGQFWLQMSDKIDAIEEIQAELQANSENYAEIESREMGTLCVAKYCADDQWYRAEILDSDADITTVRFIDYGNTDVLDNQPGLLKVIPDHLKEIERYAVKCSVNAVPTGTGQWSEPASDFFTQLVGDLLAPLDALIVLKDITTYVDVFVNGQNLTDKLVSEGHATRSEETECGGDLPTCFASHVNSPSEFWIQLETTTAELQSMEALMIDAENFPVLNDKEEGIICAAKYPEDDCWYRAQVIVDGSEGTEVLFMDYGNASIVTELRSLPEDLKQKPALSRKCALQKPRDIKSWSRQSEMKFNELAAEGATILNIQFIASGDISIVELYLENKSVTEMLVDLCEPSVPSERPTPLGQDALSSGKISHANSIEEFYVHLDTSSSDLAKIKERLVDAAEFESIAQMKVGSLCAALREKDEHWYRARIIELCDTGSHVLFIDHGDKAKCEHFRQLPEDLMLIEPVAKCCQLAPLDGLNEASKKSFNDLISKDYTFQIDILDMTKEPMLVKMLLHGEDITNVISRQISLDAELLHGEDNNDVISGQISSDAELLHGEDITDVISGHISLDAELLHGEDNTDVISEQISSDAELLHGEDITDVISGQISSEAELLHSEVSTNVISGQISSDAEQTSSNIEEDNISDMKPIEIENVSEEQPDIESSPEQTSNLDKSVDLDTSQSDPNESFESANTVIINQSFCSTTELEALEADTESIYFTPMKNNSGDRRSNNTEDTLAEHDYHTPEKDSSVDTLERSNDTADTIPTPERDLSKESINTDTGYTSGEKSKDSESDTLNESKSPQ